MIICISFHGRWDKFNKGRRSNVAEQIAPRAAEAEVVTVRKAPANPLRQGASGQLSLRSEEKIDRRVRKTKRQLREALTTLLLEKKFSDITVREISELADVNRGTFYTHYRDTTDLLHQLESSFLNRLREIIVTVKRQDWERATYAYLEEVFTLCRDNADIYRALVCNGSDPDFEERFVITLRNQYLRSFLEHVCRTEERIQELYCVYIVDGMLAIVSLWLNTGMKETPEEMSRIGGDFIMRGVKGLR